MDARKFNAIMPSVNEEWLARILNMRVNPNSGPDLIDDYKFVEVKFRLEGIDRVYGWTVQDHQLRYAGCAIRYWALGTYALSNPVSNIRTTNHSKLEGQVSSRGIWIVRYDWMRQFKRSVCTGTGNDGVAWRNVFRYSKKSKLPKTCLSVEIEKGVIHLTEGVDRKDFSHLV